MNKIEKTIGLSIIGLAVTFGGIYLFLILMGRQIVAKEIEGLVHKKTTIGYLNISPALNLEIKDLQVQGLAKVKSISVSSNIFSFFTGRIVFDSVKIVSPEFTFSKDPAVVVGKDKTSKDVILPVLTQPKATKLLPVGFRRIVIENGVVNYIDQSISASGIKIVLKGISSQISNLYFYPCPIATNFELRGKIPWRQGQDAGQLDIEGWINFFKKDMQATLKIKDIDAIYLYPYYSAWVDLEKARIEKAKLNFTVDANGLNNDINAECRLELTDMVRKPLEPGQGEEKASRLTNKVLDMFKTIDQGKVELKFSIKTKMDSPQFGLGNFKGAFEKKISQGMGALSPKPENALAMPIKIMENGVRSFTDLTRAMIDGVFAIGGEIVNAGKSAPQEYK
ncbi:MAG: DUF748 domain-containing protein [Candidatus Omnitrophota bacterium]